MKKKFYPFKIVKETFVPCVSWVLSLSKLVCDVFNCGRQVRVSAVSLEKCEFCAMLTD